MYIYLLAAVLFVLILSCIFTKDIRIISIINIVSMLIILLITLMLGVKVSLTGSANYLSSTFYIDSLSFIQLLIITSVSFITAVYSYKYIDEMLHEKEISMRKARIYYFLFAAFVFSMIFLSISNNVMAMWIGLEATTLSTAFLIGFHNSKLSLEAAWKYVILCSIGIVIGLVGIILFIYSANKGSGSHSLEWTNLLNNYRLFDKNIIKIAFTLIFIGIGTKAGLAPMHTWLSDGHSEAPSPISAMMSGILINLALYVIVRFYVIVKLVSGVEKLKYLFIVFGCISLIISTFSILKQSNYKRLLAFSSVENMGIISLGFGFGGPVGVFGALLHSIIHAYGKSLLFLVAGNILNAFKTKRIDKVSCLIKTMPVNAVFFILGMLVITGTPPFASFFSEFNILKAGIDKGNYIAVSIFAICLLLAFAGFLLAFVKMIFVHENIEYKRLEKDKDNILPLAITLAFIIIVSCTFNGYLYPVFRNAVSIICG